MGGLCPYFSLNGHYQISFIDLEKEFVQMLVRREWFMVEQMTLIDNMEGDADMTHGVDSTISDTSEERLNSVTS